MICEHKKIRLACAEGADGRTVRRFFCVHCDSKLAFSCPAISDVDRVIPSKKYSGKTLADIYADDPEYVQWCAVRSRLPQADRYACARICLHEPYIVPKDREIIENDHLYTHAVRRAIDFIKSNGGSI